MPSLEEKKTWTVQLPTGRNNALKDWELDVERLAARPDILNMFMPVLLEVQRRANHPGTKWVPDDHPERNQLGFHQSEKTIRLLFGGNQSGKSHGAAMECKWWLEGTHPYQQTPNAPEIYVISADYRTLRKGVWRHLKECLSEWMIERMGPRMYGDVPQWIKLVNGAGIEFISGDGGEEARKKLQAAACDLIIIDEEIPRALWEELMARRLSYGGRVVISATLYRSEEWLLELEERGEVGDPYIDLFRMRTERAVAAGHVDKDVYEEMKGTLSDEEVHVRLEGHSRRRQGLVYPEFGRSHIVDEAFIPPPEWTRYCSIDPGFRTCAVLWGAVREDGTLFIYREGYFHAQTYHTLAEYIYRSEGYKYSDESETWVIQPESETIRTRWIDPSAFHHIHGGDAIRGGVGVGALLAADYGIICAPARNAVHVGIEKVKQYMMPSMSSEPRLRVMRTQCPNLIREFQSYRWMDDRGTKGHERSDAPVKRNDHALDALRYMIIDEPEYKTDSEEWRRTMAERERKDAVKAAAGMDQRLADWWMKRHLQERRMGQGGGDMRQHVGGLGNQF